MYTWGIVAWGMLTSPVMGYKTKADTFKILVEESHTNTSPRLHG